jgi:hypothetical protein
MSAELGTEWRQAATLLSNEGRRARDRLDHTATVKLLNRATDVLGKDDELRLSLLSDLGESLFCTASPRGQVAGRVGAVTLLTVAEAVYRQGRYDEIEALLAQSETLGSARIGFVPFACGRKFLPGAETRMKRNAWLQRRSRFRVVQAPLSFWGIRSWIWAKCSVRAGEEASKRGRLFKLPCPNTSAKAALHPRGELDTRQRTRSVRQERGPRMTREHARRDRAGRTRTYNPRFWRPVLCQLSYGPRRSA